MNYHGRWTRLVLMALALLLAFSPLPARATPAGQSSVGSQYTVGNCSQIDKEQLRDEIERHVLAVLQRNPVPLDIDALVDRKWVELGMDATVDAEVTRAVQALGSQEDYFNRLISAWWGEKAQEFAERVANDAFGSPTFRARLNELSTAIGAEVARQVETQFAQAASVALLCLRAYVGEQYSASIFQAFSARTRTQALTLNLATTNTPAIDTVAQHQLALAGVGTILVTQLVYRLAQKLSEKIAQRVAGKVVGRVLGKAGSSLIPIAGWVIGIGMIIYDLWEGGQGALPQIEEALQSEEVKSKIRGEIATAIKDDLPEQAALIALETAVSLTEQWQGFCSVYAYVCVVAEENATFRQILQDVTLDELDQLATLVNFYMLELGRSELERAVGDGSLERLLLLPDAALQILRETHSTATTTAWADLAGDSLEAVAAYNVHAFVAPADLTAGELATLLGLGSATNVQKLLSLAPEQRTALLGLSESVLQELVNSESVADLEWLAGYMLESGQARERVADAAATGSVSVDVLREPPVVATAVPLAASTAQGMAPTPEVAALAPVGGELQSLQPLPEDGTIIDPNLLLIGLLVLGIAGAGVVWFRRRPRRKDNE